MLNYFSLPYNTNRVYHTRNSETSFRYLFVPMTPAGEAIRDQYLLQQEQISLDYENAINPLSGDPMDPEALEQLKQFRIVVSHVHPLFAAITAHQWLFPTRNRPGHWFLSVACHLFAQISANDVDPPAWFRRRYKGIEFETYYDDDDDMDANTSDEELLRGGHR
ncbi:uncharacterized protein EV420DRAFT_437202 [Desarmillaria tabescens]|uniref:Uncharacterized protein n=1 Tax=Armillaria tabescens TaxID=1929756 RepID=A0AA39NM62_ARMTA|nr:uncharacterized protein EV420DRAFT_437202 [Desarmillaria tabescens]KAK0467963.1 hypothetical protein EV420DRAFT_437202 [Desarmillaria tabescens]